MSYTPCEICGDEEHAHLRIQNEFALCVPCLLKIKAVLDEKEKEA